MLHAQCWELFLNTDVFFPFSCIRLLRFEILIRFGIWVADPDIKKTADRWFSQNPHAWISNLASCASLDPLSYPTVSPEMTGSVSTSLHTVLRSSASRFLGSLWHVKTNWRLKSALPVSKFYLYILFSVIGHMIKVFLVLFPVILSLLGSVQLNLT